MNVFQYVDKDIGVEGNDENKHDDMSQNCHKKHDKLVCEQFGNFDQPEPGNNDVGEEKGE